MILIRASVSSSVVLLESEIRTAFLAFSGLIPIPRRIFSPSPFALFEQADPEDTKTPLSESILVYTSEGRRDANDMMYGEEQTGEGLSGVAYLGAIGAVHQ